MQIFWRCSDTLILLILPKVIRGKFVTGKLTKGGAFSIAVSNTKQNNTCTQIKALYPPAQ